MLVAIDTSTNQMGLACYTKDGIRAEYSWDSQRNHTTQLIPQLDTLLRRASVSLDALQAIAVALGPGSWSGLRAGLSAAKGIAIARDIPIIGISTLAALTYQYAGNGHPVVPLIRLGRERFATNDPAGGAARNITLDLLRGEIGVATLFCGDIDGDVRTTLSAMFGKRARFPSNAGQIRRPGYLAELAWQRFAHGDTDDLVTLEPIYLGQAVKTAPV
jgi:tRNA threonylcarbamoyladenosine biosynthesis protein TsaB